MTDSLSPEDAAEVYVQALNAQKAGDTRVAVDLYAEIASRCDDKELIASSIENLQNSGENEAAVAAIRTALERWPESPMFLMRAAIACEETGNFTGAVEHLKRIANRYPDKSRYWVRLADACTAAGSWDGAEDAYKKALEIAPLDPKAAIGHSESLVQLGRIDDALTSYRRVVKLNPDHADATLRFGNLLSATNNADEAILVLRRAVQLNPKSAAAHASLGNTLHYSGHEDEGLKLCRKAMELDPDLLIAREATGVLLLEQGKLDEATELLNSIDRAHTNLGGLIAKYLIGVLSENVESAERALQHALKLNPQNGEIRHLLAALHGEPVAHPAPSFVESTFARLARRYDSRMINLAYDMPHKAAEFIKNARMSDSEVRRWLDLGCGTGLVASALEGVIKIGESVGVDITQNMIHQAADKNLYHHLIHGDATDALRELSGAFDLITAIDLFAYLGDVREFLTLISERLSDRGIFVFTHAHVMEGSFKLDTFGRFSHSSDYLEKLIAKSGLKVVAQEPAQLKFDMGGDAKGQIIALSREG